MKEKITPTALIATLLLVVIPINVFLGIINGIRLIWWYSDYRLKVFITHVVMYFVLWLAAKVVASIAKDKKKEADALEARERLNEWKKNLK